MESCGILYNPKPSSFEFPPYASHCLFLPVESQQTLSAVIPIKRLVDIAAFVKTKNLHRLGFLTPTEKALMSAMNIFTDQSEYYVQWSEETASLPTCSGLVLRQPFRPTQFKWQSQPRPLIQTRNREEGFTEVFRLCSQVTHAYFYPSSSFSVAQGVHHSM